MKGCERGEEGRDSSYSHIYIDVGDWSAADDVSKSLYAQELVVFVPGVVDETE